MPWPSAPIVTAASPVSTPARAWSAGSSSGTGGDEVERRAHRPLGVVLVRDRRAPDRHHRVADELLDRAAVALDQRAARVEVAREQLAHLLGVAALGQRREADEVGEEHRDEPPLGRRRVAGASRRHRFRGQRASRTRRRSAGPARAARRKTGTQGRAPYRTRRRTSPPAGSRSRRTGRPRRERIRLPMPRLALCHGRPHGTRRRAGALLPRGAGAHVGSCRLQRPQAGGGRRPPAEGARAALPARRGVARGARRPRRGARGRRSPRARARARGARARGSRRS